MKNNVNQAKVALVYDKINTNFGGAEVVLRAIHEIFPQAPLYTSIYDKKRTKWTKNIKIKTSFLQKFTFLTTNHKFFLPLFPIAFESLDLSEYDLIISITSAEAKGILTKPNQKHICYLLTPTRYLFSHQETYLSSKKIFNYYLIKKITLTFLNYLKIWDLSASTRPDKIISISKLVNKRVEKYYKRTSQKIIYPPVSIDLSKKEIDSLPKIDSTYFLSVSRLVKYKRVDLSILSSLRLQKRLVVVGTGEEFNNLQKLAGQSGLVKDKKQSISEFFDKANQQNKAILFTKQINKKDLYILYKNSKALLMPGQEDFGITALEAGIFGKPVIVFYTSGVSELLQENKHAVFIKKETVSELTYALGKIDSLEFDAEQLRVNALKHSVEKFKSEFKIMIEQELKG